MSMSDMPSDIIADYVKLLRRSPVVPEIAAFSLSETLPVRTEGRSCAVILSPHPDDECLTGALPLRLKQELGWQIVNVAVSLGSKLGQRERRKQELAKACAVLGFDCVLSSEDGFSGVTPQDSDPVWTAQVTRIAEIIDHYQPQAIFMPHGSDAHPTHIGTHMLGMDALAAMGAGFSCSVIQSEYWQPIEEPNLMIGMSEAGASELLTALACHAGENARNPFDARFPSYLIDNVRRGSERVGGAGAMTAAMDFAMLYKLGVWQNGRFLPSALKRIVGAGDVLTELIG